ncbi:MAG: rhomboid family intramembrane serine protease [Chloroflexota bacterium]|nr:rhomboid family intramembrane serine protease [Chloroflexota bacterium]
MIPLRDANPIRRRPVVTLAIMTACFAIFGLELMVQATGGEPGLETFYRAYGVVPVDLLEAVNEGRLLSQPVLALIAHQFLHGGWFHIGSNMLYLWIFGNNVEDRLGRPAYLLFYLAGGVVAALAQVAIDPASDIPLVGASGAIAAVLGAYFVLFPRARVLSIVFVVVFFQLIEVPAVLVLGLWFLLQVIDGLASLGATEIVGGVAIFAHIGGFVAGMLLGLLVRLRNPRPVHAG